MRSIILLMVALAMVLWGIQGAMLRFLNSKTNAAGSYSVQGVKLTQSDLLWGMHRAQSTLDPTMRALIEKDEKIRNIFEQSVVEQVAKRKKVGNVLQRMEWQADPLSSLSALKSDPVFVKEGKLSPQAIQDFLSHLHLKESEFIQTVALWHVHDLIAHAFTSMWTLRPSQQTWLHAMASNKIFYRHLLIEPKHCSGEVLLQEKELQSYYEKHQERYRVPRRIRLEYLLLDHTQLKPPVVSEAMLKDFYYDNQSMYTTPTMFYVSSLVLAPSQHLSVSGLKKIKKWFAGSDQWDLFVSEQGKKWDFSNLESGKWQMAYALPESIVEQFQEAPMRTISDPIRSDKGYVFYKLERRKPMTVKPFDGVREEVKRAYQKRVEARAYQDALQQLSDLSYTHPLASIAQTMHLHVKKTSWIKKGDPLPLLFRDKKIRKILEDHKFIESSANSDVIELAPEQAIVFRVSHHEKARLKHFDEAHAEVAYDLKTSRAKKACQHLMTQIQDQLKQGKDAETLIKLHQLHWTHSRMTWPFNAHLQTESLVAGLSKTHPFAHFVDQNGTHLLQWLGEDQIQSNQHFDALKGRYLQEKEVLIWQLVQKSLVQ